MAGKRKNALSNTQTSSKNPTSSQRRTRKRGQLNALAENEHVEPSQNEHVEPSQNEQYRDSGLVMSGRGEEQNVHSRLRPKRVISDDEDSDYESTPASSTKRQRPNINESTKSVDDLAAEPAQLRTRSPNLLVKSPLPFGTRRAPVNRTLSLLSNRPPLRKATSSQYTSGSQQLRASSKYSPIRPIRTSPRKQLRANSKYSPARPIRTLSRKQPTFSPVSRVRLNSNTPPSTKQVTSLQHRVHQPSVRSEGDSNSTGESEDESDYGDNFDLTAALRAREEYLWTSQRRRTKENPPKRHEPIFALCRSILLARLVTDSGTYEGHLIDPWFDRFPGLVEGMMKKAWLEAITKLPKAVQKKANRIPDPVSARKLFDAIGNFRNHAITKVRALVREVYGLGFNDAPELIVELLADYNFIALDYTKPSDNRFRSNAIVAGIANIFHGRGKNGLAQLPCSCDMFKKLTGNTIAFVSTAIYHAIREYRTGSRRTDTFYGSAVSEAYTNLLGSWNQMSRKRQSGIWLRLQPAVIKHAANLTPIQSDTIEIIKDPHKDDLDDLIADLSDDARERFLASLSDDETDAIINSGYLSASRTMLSSLPSLSQRESSRVGQTSLPSLSQMESSRVGQTSPPSLSRRESSRLSSLDLAEYTSSAPVYYFVLNTGTGEPKPERFKSNKSFAQFKQYYGLAEDSYGWYNNGKVSSNLIENEEQYIRFVMYALDSSIEEPVEFLVGDQARDFPHSPTG